ncbi:MAG: hypothetical protein DWQ44_12565 [Bacteroidetes bacterium]|nr:MAG: hypothetical protein DWQ33_07440 [Bacteroidota bacterium]REK08109.1 MAG: hypothetical protein DWQ39_00710 [Bacteroidota bacterium]REK32314.1 MAG: hypothetical protein DWQ44_12565 [Bacteroidota bacterium]REK49548.1 MAG: hypothetical protein DWQ48_07025 [Bacteroidota bacterium]
MNGLSEVLLYFVPAFLVLVGMFMLVKRFLQNRELETRKFLEKEYQLRILSERENRKKEAMPIRLQAYERLVLFLERISPNSILVRVHRGGMTAPQLQAELNVTIRSEFEHNLSQQIYVSAQAWEAVKEAKEETVRMINNAFSMVGTNASGIQMSSQIFEQALKMDSVPTQKAVNILKAEALKLLE